MKRTVLKVLALCLAACLLLTACGRAKTTNLVCEDLTMEIPSNYKEISGEAAAAYTFALSNNKTSVMGLREEKAAFAAYGLNPTLEEYADLVMAANSKEMSVSTYNDQILLEFESYVNGNTFIYLASVYETGDAFWLVQCACLKSDYEEYRGDMFAMLTSVKV